MLVYMSYIPTSVRLLIPRGGTVGSKFVVNLIDIPKLFSPVVVPVYVSSTMNETLILHILW